MTLGLWLGLIQNMQNYKCLPIFRPFILGLEYICYVCMCLCIYMYIICILYIYIARERERGIWYWISIPSQLHKMGSHKHLIFHFLFFLRHVYISRLLAQLPKKKKKKGHPKLQNYGVRIRIHIYNNYIYSILRTWNPKKTCMIHGTCTL